MSKLIFISIFFSLFFVACNKTETEPVGLTKFNSKYYIQAYIDANEIDISQNKSIADTEQPSVSVSVKGILHDYRGNNSLEKYKQSINAAEFIYDNFGGLPTAYIPNDGDSTSIKSINQIELNAFLENDSKTFLKLASKYNDTSWNGYTVTPVEHYVVDDSILDIEIITDSDFNENYKAGDNLASVVKFIGSSPYDFIQNGYAATREHIWTDEMDLGGVRAYTYEPIICYCSEIKNTQTKLFDKHFDLLFTQKPTSGTYNFELKLKLSQKEITQKFSMKF